MKRLSYLFILLVLLAISCSREGKESCSLLDVAEQLLESDVDSASRLLDSISPLNGISDKDLAHWCMLQGKVVDKQRTPLPSFYYYEQAAEWYSSYGTAEEYAQILLYLGRSHYEDGDYDKAMSSYTTALEVAKKNNLDNNAAYIYCYMGDLYEARAMWTEAINKYHIGAEYFEKTGNTKSYACTLRDIGRQYAKMDSLSSALVTLFKADSIASTLNNKHIQAEINNHIGNVYSLQEDYEKAKEYFYLSLKSGVDTVADYIAIIGIYIETDSLHKAKKLLESLSQYSSEYDYSIKNLYYKVYKAEGKYELALENLEEFTYQTDSIMYAENQSKILNIDKKYNEQKNRERINELADSRQLYIIFSVVCVLVILIIILVVSLYRKRVKGELQKQRIELGNAKSELLGLSLELEKKKAKISLLSEQGEEYQKTKGEAASLASAYRKLQHKMIATSSIYKELTNLANQNKPGNDKLLITDRHWQRIVDEITAIYPTLRGYVFNVNPGISDSEWQYCCFFMYGFDVNAEARLLNINPASVRTKHLRLKDKLQITLPPKTSLHDYLVENLL